MLSSTRVEVSREEDRYVAEVGGVQAGYTVYRIGKANRYFFPHTEVFAGWSGKGVASILVRKALDDVRAHSGLVVPICPFVWDFIQRNPDYADLVDHEIFDRIADGLHGD